MKVDDVLVRLARLYYFQLPNIETDIQDTKIAISQARQQLKELVLGCVPTVIKDKDFPIGDEEYCNGYMHSQEITRGNIEELFK